MARCTKEEALATRHRLLDAAEHVFSEKGVSRSSLNDIALAAGATRGAIYWHFKNKTDLFHAMMERITMPMEDVLHQIQEEGDADPLDQLQRALMEALRKIETDAQTRRVFEVAILKVEYVEEQIELQDRHRQCRDSAVQQMQRSLEQACTRRGVTLPWPAAAAAQGLHALMDGLIRNWLLAPTAFGLVEVAQATMQVYLKGLGLRSDALRGEQAIP
ncbi:MAG: TetR family transcriptional regulator [Rhodoferax sp.]|nr:TetR family transcriptional regulator [Rhodoferax sp.]